MRSLVQKMKSFNNGSCDGYLVAIVAALAATVVTFSILWLHVWYAY